MSYFRKNIDAMTAYVPGEQPAAGQKVIKLNTNENPYPPSPRAMEVLRNFDADWLRRYPHPMAKAFSDTVARVLGVDPSWVLPGNGSDELIVMISRACGQENAPIVYPVPTFEFYQTQAEIQQAGPLEVPFDDDFNLPVDELAACGGAVTFVANPNSPSGTVVSNEVLRRLAERLRGLLVIDEAYIDFAEDNALDLVRDYPNVMVIRTLSKGYSLAGLRLGYAVARPERLNGLLKVKDIYNVSAMACAVGAAAFEDQDYKNLNADKIKAQRTRLTSGLRSLNFRVWPSETNFVLARPEKGNAEAIYQNLKRQGILVRYFNSPRLCDKLRITLGTEEQNTALLDALQGMRS